MSADLALQKAIVSRLKTAVAVTALVPADSILDRHALPAPDPSIVLGESQAVEGDDIARKQQRIYFTLHIWKREPGLRGCKEVAGAVRSAINTPRLVLEAGYYLADCRVSQMRFLRDPDNETSHGVVTVEALVVED